MTKYQELYKKLEAGTLTDKESIEFQQEICVENKRKKCPTCLKCKKGTKGFVCGLLPEGMQKAIKSHE